MEIKKITDNLKLYTLKAQADLMKEEKIEEMKMPILSVNKVKKTFTIRLSHRSVLDTLEQDLIAYMRRLDNQESIYSLGFVNSFVNDYINKERKRLKIHLHADKNGIEYQGLKAVRNMIELNLKMLILRSHLTQMYILSGFLYGYKNIDYLSKEALEDIKEVKGQGLRKMGEIREFINKLEHYTIEAVKREIDKKGAK